MVSSANYRYTLGFITRGDEILMLRRSKSPNQGLWNGVGGKLELGETPRAGMLREIAEETGLVVERLRFAGLLTWEGFEIPSGGLYIFTAVVGDLIAEPIPCSEGILAWKPREWVLSDKSVVSNIHRFGSEVLGDSLPRRHHFEYQGGEIVQYTPGPLIVNFDVG